MVDDILTIQKCANESLKINSVVNGFIETKKLRLNDKKCHRIHIQKQKNNTRPQFSQSILSKLLCVVFKCCLKKCFEEMDDAHSSH